MMKTINKLTIIIAIISISTFTNGQSNGIEYDGEIILPNLAESVGIGASAPRDIIHANQKIYIYTFKQIVVYNETMTTCLGKIPLDGCQFGHFAPQFHNPHYYAPDIKLMTHDYTHNKLYFVSPNLRVQSVNTGGTVLDTTAETEIQPHPLVYYKSLHGSTKLEYDNTHHRLYWHYRSKDQYLHSWDSFLGVYSMRSNGWETIFSEFLYGTDGEGHGGDYYNLISTFTFNPALNNHDFYISRKHKIEVRRINGNTADSITTHPTTQERNGKLLVVNSKDALFVFPYRVGYDVFQEHKIYQINTQNVTVCDSVLAPSKSIMGALFLSNQNELLVCYPDDVNRQVDTTICHDMAHLSFVNGQLQFPQTFCTQSEDEIDTNEVLNLNRPFKLLEKNNGTVLVNKKNEIVELQPSNNYLNSPLYYSRDNFFGKGLEVGNRTFVINSMFGINFFVSGMPTGAKRTTYPAFNTEYNPIGRKMYLFNRLTTDNTGFYVYDLNADSIEAFVHITKPIGDLKYNAAQNHILVSQFCDGTAKVRVFDATTLIEQDSIEFFDKDYPGRMFIAPNGTICFSLNMKSDQNSPGIKMLKADNYSISLGGFINTQLVDTNTYIYTFQSHYCYNPNNNLIYATFGPYQSKSPPYQSSYNSSYYALDDPTDFSFEENKYPMGKFLSTDKNGNADFIADIELPSEILCIDGGLNNNDKDYLGSVVISHQSSSNGINLYFYDCKTGDSLLKQLSKQIFDLEYCPTTNCLYAYEHERIGHDSDVASDENIIHIHKIHEDGTHTEIWSEHGFASSISYNKYDDQLYLYYRSDEKLLGQQQAKLITLDPHADANAETQSILLPFKNLFNEVVPQANHPHFDPYNNKAYFPNGVHSSVSVVGFEAKEVLALSKDTDWLSIPRLPSNATDDWDEKDSTLIVWDRNNFETPYTEIQKLYHWHTEASTEGPLNVSWNLNTWTYVPDVDSNKFTWSVKGYQLDVLPDSDNYIYMTGNIKDPATSFPLYNGKKNWVGYFLPGEQDIFDALGASTLENLSNFKHRDYYCYRGPAIEGPTGGIVNGYPWRCDQQQTNIAYGDMVQLKVTGNIADFDMIWQNPGSTPRDKIRPEPSHFEFAETGTYTPILIELDYTNNPLEIGAFVDDSCMGAESVMESDTVIILRAYLNGSNLDSVVFQDWDGTKSAGRIIKNYTVYNPNTGIYENRALMSNTDEEMPRVSFRKKNKEKENGLVDHKIGIWPNPTANVLNYSFACEDKTDVKVALLDVSGRQLKLLLNQRFTKGFYQRTAILSRSIAGHLAPSVYFVRFDIGGYIETKKLVIN